ncbi:LamG-like jellyroll fold domain-containing protein [Catenuloplanes sp. NPDC051500]|uniref:LamG domain-containing protein n=1 Tax=Catenuloplanes sp. NPDC051500 TaxID=3363959 RepID=UPI0037A1CE71
MLRAFRTSSRRRLALLLSAVVGLSLNPLLAQPTAAARPESEVERAAASGERVEVMSERTEFSQVFAEPSGVMVMESTVVPKRVRHGDGSWSDVNLELSARPDGTIRPGASIADVRFSGGGTGPMVTLNDAGKTLELSWPGVLRPPTVSGDAATYSNVMPDVDLVLRATWTGFTHVLVVKTPEAAEAVASVTVEVGGDASVERLEDGGLRATVGRTVLATAATPVMWDSAPMPANAQARVAQTVTPGDSSTPASPGVAANSAAVATEVTAQGDLRLVPDAGLLASPEQHFPLFIDPAWDRKPAKWAYATENNADNPHTNARVGWNPGSGKKHRSFFKFPTPDLAGTYIHSARVQMKVDHSWSCDDTPTSMWWSDAIGIGDSGVRVGWGTRLIGGLVAASSHGNEADGCGSKQEDMIVQFQNNAVKNQVQTAAKGRWADLTVGFCACDLSGAMEGYAERWKTFHPNGAVLVVEYDTPPGTPDYLMVEPNTYCGTPISTGTLTPRLYAYMRDADKTQKLAATFEWRRIPGPGQVDDGTYPTSSTTVSEQSVDTQSSPVAVTIKNGERYAFRVQTRDPAPYNILSPWSAWCEFYVDTTVPKAPTIIQNFGDLRPGDEASFTISTPELDVTKFRYGWKDSPEREVGPTLTTAANGTQTMTARVKLSVRKYGESIFLAQGIDATLNRGVLTKSSVDVLAPVGAVARYGLQTYPGVDIDAALGAGTDNALTATGVTWTDDVRIIGGKTATFSGTASQNVDSGLRLDTSKSFSIAAWVRLTDLTTTSTLVAKNAPAGQTSPFRIRARPLSSGGNAWCLIMVAAATSTAGTEVCSTALNTVNQWAHVAGGFDKADGQIRIWVDGKETSASFSTPITNDGTVAIGRGTDAVAGVTDRLRGNVADALIFARPLMEDDFTGSTAVRTDDGEVGTPGILDPIEVGWWTFTGGYDCSDESNERLCQVRADDSFQRQFRTNLGTKIGEGRDGGSAIYLDDKMLDGTPNPKPEYGQTQRNDGSDNEPDWVYAPVLRTDQSFTVSAWAKPQDLGTGAHTILSQDGPDRTPFGLSLRPATVSGITADYWTFSMVPPAGIGGDVVTSAEPVVYGDAVWTHVVGVYDAAGKEVRLYVNGVLQAATNKNFAVWQATGPLTVGGALFSGVRPDRWHGGIDDLHTYQGALDDVQVLRLFNREVRTSVG